MQIRVLFFGATAQAVGMREVRLTITETTKPKTLIDELSHQNPALAKHKLLIAVNEEYADGDTPLNDGDSLAIFTAVSGG